MSDFSDETEANLISEYAAAEKNGDQEKITALTDEAFARMTAYLDGDMPVSEDESPLFFSFIRAFSKTGRVDLDMLAKRAEAKITPVLKEFDKTAGYDNIASLSAEKIEENIAALEGFDTTDPFEKRDEKLIYPQFEKALTVIDAVVLTDGDQPAAEQEQEKAAFKETVVETAKLKAYMRLCVYPEELTREVYLDRLQFEIEKALITLFMMEQTTDLAAGKNSVEDVHAAFEELLNLL